MVESKLMNDATYHTRWESPVGTLGLWASQRGLARLGLPNDDPAEAARWVARYLGHEVREVGAEHSLFALIIDQLSAYFSGAAREFSLPLDMLGTPFQLAVWNAVYKVPWGTTVTYAYIAEQIGSPKAVRAVGAANGANPLPIIVPCHRVIASSGALQGYGGGLPLKLKLLGLEGVRLKEWATSPIENQLALFS